jgi:hypothetical protein
LKQSLDEYFFTHFAVKTNYFRLDIIPANVQSQLARVTGKDLLGLRALAERMTVNPTSRAEFIKELNSRAPNVLFLGTEVKNYTHQTHNKFRSTKLAVTNTNKFARTCRLML